MSPSSTSNLNTIGEELQQYKKLLLRQKIWRSLFIGSLAGGLCWGFTVPKWEIIDSSQVTVKGNRYLDKATIVSFLKIAYPQSIWQVQTGEMRQSLISLPPITDVKVSRQLFPPTIEVALREKIPVAVSTLPTDLQSSSVRGKQQSGFLDRYGDWLPNNFYNKTTAKLPTLQVKGYRDGDRAVWQNLYRVLETSSLKFSLVDWRDRNNLILHGQLGKVYLGTINRTNEITDKLRVLENMGELDKQVSRDRLDYIDLTNIRSPKIKEIVKPKTEQKRT
jgi:cell division protein FtsQ